MNTLHWRVALLAGVLACGAQTVLAQTPNQEPIYGSQLMTPEERADYHAQMHAARTAEEQGRIRDEHHAAMQARAKERGVTLPDQPRRRGMGMGPDRGMGPGGMGPGGGRTNP